MSAPTHHKNNFNKKKIFDWIVVLFIPIGLSYYYYFKTTFYYSRAQITVRSKFILLMEKHGEVLPSQLVDFNFERVFVIRPYNENSLGLYETENGR